jgi:hypothetical protein
LLSSLATGVGHEEQALPEVGRTDATSRDRTRPNGVTHSFQVIRYKVEPSPSSLARNLLSKNDWRSALVDEPLPSGPYVPLVIKPLSFACRAERLAWAGSGPDGAGVGPACVPEGVGPDSDSSEEVVLAISHKFLWIDIPNIPFVYVAWRDQTMVD